MLSQEHEAYQRGDSDDEIAELRFQALLTKKENEAEVSPVRQQPMYAPPVMSLNQPLSSYQEQHFPVHDYRGRGRGRGNVYKPYLQTFSQQIASNSVNSSNIVVLTSTNSGEAKPFYEPTHFAPRLNNPNSAWTGIPSHGIPIKYASQSVAPKLILPQDNYGNQQNTVQESDQSKAKLSARMKRLQDSDSDSEDSESDSSGSSSDSSSSDSSSSSSDSSSSDSDSDSDSGGQLSQDNHGKEPKEQKDQLKDENNEVPIKNSTEGSSLTKPDSPNAQPKKDSSPIKARSSKSPVSGVNSYKNSTSSPKRRSPYSNKGVSSNKKYSRSPSYNRKSRSISRSPMRYSRSPRRGRTPRPYRSRSPYSYGRASSPLRVTHSPLRKNSRSPLPVKRVRSRSPFFRRSRSFSPLRSRRSPLPVRKSPFSLRYRSRSPNARRYDSRSPFRHGGSRTSPRGRYYSKSPQRGGLSPRSYNRRSRSHTPKRFRSSRSPVRYNSKSPYRGSSMKRKLSRSPDRRYRSRSPLPFSRSSPRMRSPYGNRKSPYLLSPHRAHPSHSPNFCSPENRQRFFAERSPSPGLSMQQNSRGNDDYIRNHPDEFDGCRRHEVGNDFRPPSNEFGRRSPNIPPHVNQGPGLLPFPPGNFSGPPHHGERLIRPLRQDISIPPPNVQRFPPPNNKQPLFAHGRFPHPNSQRNELDVRFGQPLIHRLPISLPSDIHPNMRPSILQDSLRLPLPLRPNFPGTHLGGPGFRPDIMDNSLIPSLPPHHPSDGMRFPIHNHPNGEPLDNFGRNINEQFDLRVDERGRPFRGSGRNMPPRGGFARNEGSFGRPPFDHPDQGLNLLRGPVSQDFIQNRQFHDEHPPQERHTMHLNPEKLQFHGEHLRSGHIHPEGPFHREPHQPMSMNQERHLHGDHSIHHHSPPRAYEPRSPLHRRRSFSPFSRGPRTPPFMHHRERSVERNRQKQRGNSRSPSPMRRNYRGEQIDRSPNRHSSLQRHESRLDENRDRLSIRSDKQFDERRVKERSNIEGYSKRDEHNRKLGRSRSPVNDKYRGKRILEDGNSFEMDKRSKIEKDEKSNVKSMNENVNRKEKSEEMKGKEFTERPSSTRSREEGRRASSSERSRLRQREQRTDKLKDEKLNARPESAQSSKERANSNDNQSKEKRNKEVNDRRRGISDRNRKTDDRQYRDGKDKQISDRHSRDNRDKQVNDRHGKVNRDKQVDDRHGKSDRDKQTRDQSEGARGKVGDHHKDDRSKQVGDRRGKDDRNKQVSDRQAKDEGDKQVRDHQSKDDRNKLVGDRHGKDDRSKQVADRQSKDDGAKQMSVRQGKDDRNKQISDRQVKDDKQVSNHQVKDDEDKQIDDRQRKDDKQISDRQGKGAKLISDRQGKDDKQVSDVRGKDDRNKQVSDVYGKDDRNKQVSDVRDKDKSQQVNDHSKDDRGKQMNDRNELGKDHDGKEDKKALVSDRLVKVDDAKQVNDRRDRSDHDKPASDHRSKNNNDEIKSMSDRLGKNDRDVDGGKKAVVAEPEEKARKTEVKSAPADSQSPKSCGKKQSITAISEENSRGKGKENPTKIDTKNINYKRETESRESKKENKEQRNTKSTKERDAKDESLSKHKREIVDDEIEEGELVKQPKQRDSSPKESKKKKKKKDKLLKKKKEKKKKKESKKKSKRHRDSDSSEQEFPSEKKAKVSRSESIEKRGKRDYDQRKVTAKFSDRHRSRDVIRRKEKDLPISSEEDGYRISERRNIEERRQRERDVYHPTERSREDRRPLARKKDPNALVVTVRSDDNRRVLSGGSGKNVKAAEPEEGGRLPVHMRLGGSTLPLPSRGGRPLSRTSQTILNRNNRGGRTSRAGGAAKKRKR